MGQVAYLMKPLYGAAKEVLFQSKVIGTDDTGVKVLDEKLPFARTGRIWPYHGDQENPVIVYDYRKPGSGPGRRSSWRDIADTYRQTPMPDTMPFSKTRRAD